MYDVGNVNMYSSYAFNLMETDEELVNHIAIRRKHVPHYLMRGIQEWSNLRRTQDSGLKLFIPQQNIWEYTKEMKSYVEQLLHYMVWHRCNEH